MGHLDTLENQAHDTAVRVTRRLGGKLLRLAARKGLALGGKVLGAAIGSLVATVGLPVAVMVAVLLVLLVLVAAFYSAMPGGVTLLGVNPDPQDIALKQQATSLVQEWNVKETWLVPDKGRWYPRKGTERFGEFRDRYGRDVKLINQWGDVYAPVLYLASSDPGNDKLRDEGWVKEKMEDAAEKLRPYFYYKESTVTVSRENGSEETFTVYLLVEAYTIRGHYLFKHRWVTKEFSGGSITYEEPAGEEKLADGLSNYLRPYLVELYGIPDDTQADLAAKAVFEAGQAFSAKAENLAWLRDQVGNLLWVISGASIPMEFLAYLEEAKELTGIPVWFLAGLIEKESSWNPNAVNERTGAFGLTQLHPDYWSERARRYGFDPDKDRWNPRAQIIVGAWVLANAVAGGVDWEDLDPDNLPYNLRKALASYGGYGSDVQAADRYIKDVVERALGYRSPAVWPAPGYYQITSAFGWRVHPLWGTESFHEGVDIPAPAGAPVVSVSGGVVSHAGDMGAYGLAVIVRDTQYEYLYGHLSRIDVSLGDRVRPGTRIGAVGSTGWSTGPHLHFGVRSIGGSWIDPMPILEKLM
ncbi:peptidoglycan DD-metalloendopeptidase family protein [Moorellaceae bacterium AZ2]